MSSFWKNLEVFDIFPKTSDEIKVKSPFGATVSIIAGTILAILLIWETASFFNPPHVGELVVHHSHIGETLPINLRILFYSLPCDAITIDIVDRTGDTRFTQNKVTKSPWKGNIGDIIDMTTDRYIDKLLKRRNDRFWLGILQKKVQRQQLCQSCYEGETRPGQCCNTCYELKKAISLKGYNVQLAEKHPQCMSTDSEGCILTGEIMVNKAQGNFHIAVGESHSHGAHHHSWNPAERQLGFNGSHYIDQISFGKHYPGRVNPLDGYLFHEKGMSQQQYFIQVVPTIYQYASGYRVESNQYSFTELNKKIDLEKDGEQAPLPGIYFSYDISPLKIVIKEEGKSFIQWIVSISATLGGVWVVAGMVYRLSSTAVNAVAKKRD